MLCFNQNCGTGFIPSVKMVVPFISEGPASWERKGCLLADSAPTMGWGKTFCGVGRFFTKTAVTRKRKVEKTIRRWQIDRLAEGYIRARFFGPKKGFALVFFLERKKRIIGPFSVFCVDCIAGWSPGGCSGPFWAKNWTKKFTFHLYNPSFRSQLDLTQCDHNNCIISYGMAWYCIAGFGTRAVSRKTPIYFIPKLFLCLC